ncbi:MAG: NAD-dependent epimerase/dehydratase family protein [Acidobacteria bacterium]|nr:NAD-dependent epimerase/dehydratase family protein [Acidobacteriota bacterium]
MRVLILGASGFIGSHLARYAASMGHEIIALSRSGRVEGFYGNSGVWELGNRITLPGDRRVDCAIHLAHDFDGQRGADHTIEATIRAVTELRDAGTGRQLYFSSYSAGPHAASIYGRAKFTLEKSLDGFDDVVIVRPGLVIGNGGLFGRLERLIRLLPLIPLPGGGEGLVPTIGIERLCELTLDLASGHLESGEFNLFEPRLTNLRELVLSAATRLGKKPILVPFPSNAALVALTVLESLRLPLPVNVDNLRGFIANQQAGHRSSLPAHGKDKI